MAANKEIKNWVNDLRITDDCKGAYLTIDDNLNVAWKQGTTETRTGEVWQYNSITQDSYVILPQASINIGLCVALMRNKTDLETNPRNPKLVILPERINGEYDTIQGSKNFYTSAGVTIDSTGKISETQDSDNFSSVIFKAVQTGNNQYGWVIINGVGSWNGESINDTIYDAVQAKYTQQAISVQTAGANTLSTSGGLGSTQSEFVEFTGLKNYPKSVKGSTEIELKPFNGNDSLQYMVIAHAVNNWQNNYYTQNIPSVATFNTFGKEGSGGLKNNYYSAPTVNTVNLNPSVNWLGYLYRSSNVAYNNNTRWCQNNKEKSYTYKLIKNKLIMIFDQVSNSTRLGTAQITIPVDLNNFKLANNKSLTEVNKVYMDLDFGAEQDNASWKCYHIIAYKVPATWNDASGVNSNNISKVIPLKFEGDGKTKNNDFYSSNLVGIPLTEEDKTNGKFNLVFEFIADDENGNRTESEFARNFPHSGLYYSKFRFIGVEQLKQVSISPEVEFEQFGAWGGKEYHGSIEGNLQSNLVIYNGAYIDASTPDDKIASDWVPNVSYTGFQYKADTASKTFFNQFGSYKPNSNITKTIISACGGFPGQSEDDTPASALTYELVIDWVNRNWQFTGFFKRGRWAYHCTQQNEFSDNPVTLDFKACARNTSGTRITIRRLPDSILINGSGIIRLPYLLVYDSGFISGEGISLTWNFTHYKTVVNPSGYPIEVLCHYKCGWERAENIWTTDYIADGSEFDGLLDHPNNSSSTGLVSPSKACISPTHYRMKPDVYNIEFTEDKGLLPYYKEFNCYNNGTKKPCYYFNTQYVYSNQAMPNISDYKSSQWLTADAFCTLTFTPKTTGLLKGYIRIPQLVRAGAGRLIIKEIYNEANHTWSDYIMIKDDFGGNTRGLQILAPDTEFSDRVNAHETIRYTVILYSTVNWETNNNDAYISSVCRSAFPQDWDHWITDFKTLYDKNYISSYSIGTGMHGGGSNSSTMRKVFGREPSTTGGAFINSIAEKDGMFIKDSTDAGYFDVDKFAGSFYKDGSNRASITTDLSQNNKDADTTSANMGSPFEFLVYVMKTA